MRILYWIGVTLYLVFIVFLGSLLVSLIGQARFTKLLAEGPDETGEGDRDVAIETPNSEIEWV